MPNLRGFDTKHAETAKCYR